MIKDGIAEFDNSPEPLKAEPCLGEGPGIELRNIFLVSFF
jgi:hypothetical protein